MAFKQFPFDVHTAAGLVTHGKQCKALGERIGKGVMRYLAAPPAAPRQWVGLTTEDMATCIDEPAWDLVLRKAEQILKEKNT